MPLYRYVCVCLHEVFLVLYLDDLMQYSEMEKNILAFLVFCCF